MDPRQVELQAAAKRFSRFAEEFRLESDRGCAVLVLCVLEDALKDLFKAFVVNEDSTLLGNIAPPGRLKVAIENAQLLGLLSDRQARSFQSLVKVRNRFAHGVIEGLTFDSPDVANAVRSIEPIVELTQEHELRLRGRPVRHQFLMLSAFIWLVLAMRAAYIERIQPMGDPDINQLPEAFTVG